jgi:hypothetical protein
MKTVASLFAIAVLCICSGCASNNKSEALGLASTPVPAGMLPNGTSQLPIESTTIENALKYFTNGYTGSAYDLLLNVYDSTHDVRYLEFSCELADRQIDDLVNKYKAHYEDIRPTLEQMNRFFDVEQRVYTNWGKDSEVKPLFPLKEFFGSMKINPYFYSQGLPAENVKIVNDAYCVLTGEAQSNAAACFLPEAEQVKNKMLRVETKIRFLMSIPDDSLNAAKLMQIQNKLGKQRETLSKLRTDYLTKVFVLPRITLGRLLVYMMKHDQEHVGEIAPGLNPRWVEKLEIVFNSDNGVLISQSEQSARLEFQKLVKLIKKNLGDAYYKEFVTTLELLSNNKEGGNGYWWPAETSNQ